MAERKSHYWSILYLLIANANFWMKTQTSGCKKIAASLQLRANGDFLELILNRETRPLTEAN